ncbi:uncharacterized protein LOC114345611 isoform X1 [Diabrotica virgifera virgifera]|uniref:Uncharacterized protein LOC114345611 isoform X1 n=1 Tax=Diabrotica virgifera virgifera TaxID=50390 RepID=A0A6P7H3D1_DIAVI|nr:uncharacterized protein LOC114345611 isoform X1 [Diabrotica virgifera virgifera]
MNFNIMYLYKVVILAAILVAVSCQSYRAGIVIYKPVSILGPADTNLKINANISARLIKSYKDQADIFVLPEYGLTNIPPKSLTSVYQYSTTINEVGYDVCGSKEKVDIQLRDLACAAKDSNAYVIANLFESVQDNAYYLTTVGFDRTGTIVVKCRNYHINSTQLNTTTEQNPCTFTANINNDKVNFAILFEIDMMYPIPNASKSENLIMTASMVNRLPLEFGLSLYEGFAVANGANLLVSAFTDPTRSGSGIFYSNGTSTVAFNPEDVPGGNASHAVLIRSVPVKASKLKEVNVNAAYVGTKPITLSNLPFTDYGLSDTSKVLKKHCVDKAMKRCCSFSAEIEGNSIAPYKWVALVNTTILDQATNSLICAIALPSASIANAISFKNLTISTDIDKAEVLLSIPVGLNDKSLSSDFHYNADSHSIMSTSNDKIVVLGIIEILGGTPTPAPGTENQNKPSSNGVDRFGKRSDQYCMGLLIFYISIRYLFSL